MLFVFVFLDSQLGSRTESMLSLGFKVILVKGLFKDMWERLWESGKDIDISRDQGPTMIGQKGRKQFYWNPLRAGTILGPWIHS